MMSAVWTVFRKELIDALRDRRTLLMVLLSSVAMGPLVLVLISGLVASFEKFVLDCDLIQMVSEFLQPLETSEDALAVEAIREVGPGGHFFGAQHTLARYTTAFYAPIISDWRNNQQWLAAGKPEAWQKANAVWKQALADYQEPPIDAAIRDELNAFVERRKAEGGAPTDF